jgi:AbrB family looped-hinge helix DNA binding protein
MDTTKLSSKGQVVIPKAIRDRLSVKPGATLSVEVEDDHIVLRPVKKERRLPTEEELDRVAGSLDYGGPYPTDEEVEASLAEMFRKKWQR